MGIIRENLLITHFTQKRYLHQLILKLHSKAGFHIFEFIMKMLANSEIMFQLNKGLG